MKEASIRDFELLAGEIADAMRKANDRLEELTDRVDELELLVQDLRSENEGLAAELREAKG